MKKNKTVQRKNSDNDCQITDEKSSKLITRIIPKKESIHPFLKRIEMFHEITRKRPEHYPYPYSENSQNKTVIIMIPQDIEKEAQVLARQGRKPEAMLQIMNLTGIGLSVAKDYIDSLL